MHNMDAPPFLWDWYLDYEAEVNSCTLIPIPKLPGKTPHEHITVEMPDITELVQFLLVWFSILLDSAFIY